MTDAPDWPADIEKPPLPPGYEWVCLRRALGIGEEPNHPWWIRARWTTRDGKHRMLRMGGDYYITPQAAIDHALLKVQDHYARRSR